MKRFLTTTLIITLVQRTSGPTVEPRYFMWINHIGKSFSLDVRQDFDANNTFGGYVGKMFGNDTLWVVPEVGGLVGDSKGLGPELQVGGIHGRLRFFTFQQYVFGVGGCNNFFFTYDQVHYQYNGGLSFGMAGQMFWAQSQESFPGFDIGPQLRIDLGKTWYLKPWYTVNPETDEQKFIIGLGYTFNQ